MITPSIREKLANYMKVADEVKVKAVYTLLKDDMEQAETEFSDDFKEELDQRYAYYKSGGRMVSAIEVDKQINDILVSR